MEERIKAIMKSLECTREEALEMLADDEAIEKGEKLFELSAEQKRVSKQARSVDRKPSEQKQKRERKPDEEKREYINTFFELLTNENWDNYGVTITNVERQIDWENSEGRRFRLVLSCPRK